MAISSFSDRKKEKSRAPLPEGEAPDFPVPSLPHVKSTKVSGGE
jgi:NADH-quinone oxidoreductase subunit H